MVPVTTDNEEQEPAAAGVGQGPRHWAYRKRTTFAANWGVCTLAGDPCQCSVCQCWSATSLRVSESLRAVTPGATESASGPPCKLDRARSSVHLTGRLTLL
jgi:hypothetical protein